MENELDQIGELLDAIAQNAQLRDEAQYAERTDALDQLEFLILTTLTNTDQATDPQIARFAIQAHTLQQELVAINTQLFQRLRAMLMSPGTTPPERLRILRSYATHPLLAQPAIDDGYDHLDVLIQGILQFEPPAESDIALLEAEMVAYQPTPARAIFDLIDAGAISANDCFYDLGAGLGHVAILVGLLTGATTIGVEIDPVLWATAQHCADNLHASMVTMLRADVRSVDLSAGTIFYLYTPFTGMILHTVLDQLRLIATKHPIRICTYGPYLGAVARLPWLQTLRSPAAQADSISIFVSHGCYPEPGSPV